MSRGKSSDPLIILLAGLRPAGREGSVARTPRAPARDFVPCTPSSEWMSEEGSVARTPRAPARDFVPCTPSSEWISGSTLDLECAQRCTSLRCSHKGFLVLRNSLWGKDKLTGCTEISGIGICCGLGVSHLQQSRTNSDVSLKLP